MTEKLSHQEKLVAAALVMIEKDGWRLLSLAHLARHSKVPIETVYQLCPDKHALLKLIGASIDIAALKRMSDPATDASPRDRAFDAVLTCFEAMAPCKPALGRIHEETRADPGSWLDAAPIFVRSAHWIADNANLPTTGLRGFATARAIALLLADTMAVWLSDGDDLSKTMAHVDRRLRLAESWLEALHGLGQKQPEGNQPAD